MSGSNLVGGVPPYGPLMLICKQALFACLYATYMYTFTKHTTQLISITHTHTHTHTNLLFFFTKIKHAINANHFVFDT